MYHRILLPVDLSSKYDVEEMVEIADEYSLRFDANLTLLSVLHEPRNIVVSNYFTPDDLENMRRMAEQSLAKIVETKCRNQGAKYIVKVSNDPVYTTIIHMSKVLDIDLIMMSAHRPELKDYLLGSNAARVVRHSDVSILVVRH